MGSGQCNNCQGLGHMAGHAASPTNPRLNEKCGTCHGTGKCQGCYGTGQTASGQTCTRCWRR